MATAACTALAVVGTAASPATAAGATAGTAASAGPATVAAGVGSAGGALRSLPHSIHSSIATISQARIRNTRVWFIGQGARPAQASGVEEEVGDRLGEWGGVAAGIVPSVAGTGNAPARCSSFR